MDAVGCGSGSPGEGNGLTGEEDKHKLRCEGALGERKFDGCSGTNRGMSISTSCVSLGQEDEAGKNSRRD